MSRLRAALARVALCCAVLTGASAASAQPIRLGGEFQINAYTTGIQHYPSIAVDADGDFVVTWTSAFDGYGFGIFGHRFDSAGARQGLQFQVNTYTTYGQHRSSVASESNGDFVVVWQSFKQDGGVPGVYAVVAKRFTSAGTAIAAEFQVNIFTPNDQENPRVASDADGDFMVVWQSTGQDAAGFGGGIFGRTFSSSGVALTGEFQVNVRTTDNQFLPDVAADADGDFVVTWQSNQQEAPGSSYGIFARRFNSVGAAQGGEMQVNTYTVGPQANPSVAARADGAFLIAWNSMNQESPGSSAGNDGIFARRFTSAGAAQGVEFQVNLYTPLYQRNPRVATDDSGHFVVTWESQHQDGNYEGVFARRVGGATAFGPEFQANTYTVDGQGFPVVDFDSDGDFVIAWWTEENQDGNSYGVFAQRFKLPPIAILDVDANGTVAPFSDGLMILKYLVGLRGPNLVSGNLIGAGCSQLRCDAAGIGQYIESIREQLDVDANGTTAPFSDGLLILKRLIGLTGPNLVSGNLIAANCTAPRCDATGVGDYIQTLRTPAP